MLMSSLGTTLWLHNSCSRQYARDMRSTCYYTILFDAPACGSEAQESPTVVIFVFQRKKIRRQTR
jgi:hypothetical protein